MRRRLSLVLTLVAWLFATGSQWDLVQTFAWGRMLAANLGTMSLVAAVQRTFSPEGRCEICAVVSTAKQQEQNSASVPGGKIEVKIVLFCQSTPAPVVAVPGFSPWSLRDPLVQSAGRGAPPLPPPRSLA